MFFIIQIAVKWPYWLLCAFYGFLYEEFKADMC